MIQIRPIREKFFATNIEEIVHVNPKPSMGESIAKHEKLKPLICAVKKSLLSLAEQEQPKL